MALAFVRGVLAVVAGCLAAAAMMVIFESLGQVAFPRPAPLDPAKPGTIAEVMKAMPAGAFAFVLMGWAAGTLLGSSIAARLSPAWSLGCGMVVGGLMLGASVANMVMIPHPAWVWVVGVLLFLPTAFVGATLGSARHNFPPAGPPPEVARSRG